MPRAQALALHQSYYHALGHDYARIASGALHLLSLQGQKGNKLVQICDFCDTVCYQAGWSLAHTFSVTLGKVRSLSVPQFPMYALGEYYTLPHAV